MKNTCNLKEELCWKKKVKIGDTNWIYTHAEVKIQISFHDEKKTSSLNPCKWLERL
jgi:hypothetical protein